MVSTQVRGAMFFPMFLPSFSKLGYHARSVLSGALSPDFSGQTWLVTGASDGIGREIALSAAGFGARVVCVARSKDRLADLSDSVAERIEDAGIDREPGEIVPHPEDLSLMSNVQSLATGLSEPIDVLVNNVGVMFDRPQTTSEGLDTAFAVNLLGHYVLTSELAESGNLQPGSAVINMSSGGMYNVPLKISSLQRQDRYNGTIAYAYHKRAQVELNAYWRLTQADRYSSYVMHPGWVATPGVETSMPGFYRVMSPLLRDPAAGADTAIWLADNRPEQRKSGGIWLDRFWRSAHYLPGTRDGDAKSELISYLDEQVGAVLGDRH